MHQCQVGNHALEADVFFLQLTQLRQVRDGHARILALPFVAGRIAHAVLSARLANLCAQFDLLEDGNNLTFTESGFLHVETPRLGILYSQIVQLFAGASFGEYHDTAPPRICPSI